MDTAETLWADFKRPIANADDYMASLRGRRMNVFFMGERVPEPVDHPVIRPSINAMAETYRLATERPELGTVRSEIARAGNQPLSARADQSRRSRRQARDAARARPAHRHLLPALRRPRRHRHLPFGDLRHRRQARHRISRAVSRLPAPRAGRQRRDRRRHDRSEGRPLQGAAPAEPIPICSCVWSRRDDKGIYVSGAKMHQTGAVNSHWLIFMPTMRMTEADRDWAVVGAVRVDAPGLTYIVGRQTNDTRVVDGGAMDAGNAQFAGQESMIVFEDVFVPHEHVFMDGEWEYASSLVERFTTYHRSSYVCKTGLGDVLIGAAASAAEHNGVEAASHIKDKLVEMTHLNETIYSSCMAAAHQSKPVASGAYLNDEMLSNVAKHNVTRFPFEIARLAQDIAGGLVVTMPSEKDLQNNEIGPLIRKFLQGRDGVEVDRPDAHPAPDREHDDRPQRRRLSDRKPARRGLAAGPAHPDRARHEARGEEGARSAARRHRSDRIEVVDFQQHAAAVRPERAVKAPGGRHA